MSIPAGALQELHRIHRQLGDLRSRLQRGPRQIKAGLAKVTSLEVAVAGNKEAVVKLKMAADQKELQLKEREGKIADKRLQLNSCSNNREYQTLTEQIAADEQANSVLSDEILELFEKITDEEAVVEQAKQHLDSENEELGKLRQRLDSEKDTLENEVARLSDNLVHCESQFQSDFRQDYDRLVKGRGEECLAPLDGECCGGCSQTVTPQMVNELMLHKPVFCKSCGCILYMEEDTSAGRAE